MDQLVTREGALFQVSNRRGAMLPEEAACGLFMHDTRFLSRFELRLNGAPPELLTATTAENLRQRVFLMNGQLSIRSERLLYGAVMYERISLTNHALVEVTAHLELRFASDFVHLFEVRGYQRPHHGQPLAAIVGSDRVTLGYRGLDERLRQTELRFRTTPTHLTAEQATWALTLAPKATVLLDLEVIPAEAGAFATPVGFEAALGALQASYTDWHESSTRFDSDSEGLNRLLERSSLDLRLLTDDIGYGPFAVAGIPWFAVPFGRDSLITAILALPLRPDLALGTLRTMAALQGQEVNGFRVEEPGKIPHELRQGEMANLDEIPFRRYYGSVDSTPLFLVLVAAYFDWTGDLASVRALLPSIKAAIGWLDAYGDADGDGLLEYRADGGLGLRVQSWKDSGDSMSHRDGRPASSPVAVSEVQGYAYDAKARLAPLLGALGEHELAQRLTREAGALKERFNQAFWMADRQYFAIALDGEKQQVGTISSDIGHCLWSGIVDQSKADAVAATLLSPGLFSGWGIRTLALDEATYNPTSYHNGSVWPHDNALAVLGLKRYGFDAAANQVATGLVEAARHFALDRLPELFCGYGKAEGVPIDYPVACSPQAWAAATPYALVQAMLGLQPEGGRALRLRPVLPQWLGRLTVQGLRVGSALVDLVVDGTQVSASVTHGELSVIVEQ